MAKITVHQPDETDELIRQFMNKGGQITVCPMGKQTIDHSLKHCRCGCKGNLVEHRLRQTPESILKKERNA